MLMGVLTTHAQSVNGGPRSTYTPVPPTSVSCLSLLYINHVSAKCVFVNLFSSMLKQSGFSHNYRAIKGGRDKII